MITDFKLFDRTKNQYNFDLDSTQVASNLCM